MYKILLLISILFFSGCSLTSPSTPVVKKKITKSLPQKPLHVKTSKEKKVVLPKPLPIKEKKKLDGMIRGVIKELKYIPNKGAWYFKVDAIDSRHGKLKDASFETVKGKFDVGDLVYAILRKGVLSDIYLIQKAYHKMPSRPVKKSKIVKRKLSEKKEKKLHKRTKSRQVLSLPKVESITLD